jgi:hypothetical protein
MLLKYKKWYQTLDYSKTVFVGNVPTVQNYPKDVAVDGWFLFGKWCIYLRENING